MLYFSATYEMSLFFLFNPKHQENIAVDQHGTGKGSGCVTYPCSFKEIYTKLPEKLSKNMAKNLSVSIAFVCILHLANEKVTARHSTNHTPSPPQKKKIIIIIIINPHFELQLL